MDPPVSDGTRWPGLALLIGTSLASFAAGVALAKRGTFGSKRGKKGRGEDKKKSTATTKKEGADSGAAQKIAEEAEASLQDYDLEDEEEDEDNEPLDGYVPFGLTDGPFKLVLVVNQELKMQKGKIAAQCCHATLGCFKIASQYTPACVKGWEYMGQAKIAVKCPTEAEMLDIQAKVRAAGLVSYLVRDAGRTQIRAGSQTVLGIGPAPTSAFEGITSHLSLM